MNERVIYPSSPLEGYEQDVIYSTHAGFGSRLLAYLIDAIIIWCIKQILIDPLMSQFNLTDQHVVAPIFSAANIASALVYFLYFVLMTWFFRATIGKMIMGLKVVSYNDEPMTFFRIVVREVFGRYISNFFLNLLYLVVLFNPSRQGIHDVLSDTIVVKEQQERLRDRLTHVRHVVQPK
ncbi:RDD family protein [Macrococcus lamae]|uniref:RDD family protein n=1 Tax=Macrococcus lamae TaxID=198484 RepID=A0A4R6BU74_9STAP|nr:RDD family protein [Macrococcus lamae]TDM10598.1 RDD family protein [Macrococcus lamae]